MQMDVEEAKTGTAQKETLVASPIKQSQQPPQPKIAFDKLAQTVKQKSQAPATGAARALEEDMSNFPGSQLAQKEKETQPAPSPYTGLKATIPATNVPTPPLTLEHLELRPLKKPEPPPQPPPQPHYTPSRPALTPRSAFTRELESKPQHEAQKRIASFRVPKFVWAILIILVVGVGFVAFDGLELINNFIAAEPPQTNLPPSTTPPSATQPPSITPPSTSPLLGTKIIEVSQSQESNLKNTIRSALAEKYSLNTLTPVTVRYIENKQLLTFGEFWRALGVVPPFGLVDSLEESFVLAAYTNGNDVKRFGVRIRTQSGADATQLRNQLLSWEERFISDWQILLSSLPVRSSGQFQTVTLLGERVRFINTDLADLGVYYTLMADRGLLLIGTSRETLEALIANER